MKFLKLIRPAEQRRVVTVLVLLVLLASVVNVPFAVTRLPAEGERPPNQTYLDRDQSSKRGWPSSTPHAQRWPAPTVWIRHGHLGYAELDVRSQTEDEESISMTVKHAGWPLPVVEWKTMRWDDSNAQWQGAEKLPRPRLLLRGLIGNPLIVGVSIWLVFFAIPLVGRLRERAEHASRDSERAT
ncbi:MAG: hypothetical protein KF757_02710 [Phycisphaeraceae bacterium]|nr:hypothetical protein [Phycisphaeraceae bacterium]MCW5764283.1 hypothetical protein [Phycisphaeraceae bacterium]